MLTRLLTWLNPPPAGAIRGRVIARDTVEAPLTGRRCVYVRHVVERRSQTSDDPLAPLAALAAWQVTAVTEDVAEFYVGDERGRLLVAPYDLAVAIDERYAERAPLAHDLRAYELVLMPGDEVEVVGEIDEVADPYSEVPEARGATRCRAIRAPEGGKVRVRLLAR